MGSRSEPIACKTPDALLCLPRNFSVVLCGQHFCVSFKIKRKLGSRVPKRTLKLLDRAKSLRDFSQWEGVGENHNMHCPQLREKLIYVLISIWVAPQPGDECLQQQCVRNWTTAKLTERNPFPLFPEFAITSQGAQLLSTR